MRKVPFESGQYYHIYNRGNKKESIFLGRDNYLFFLRRLQQGIQKRDITVLAYCLMPNHFHLILKESSGHSISELMLSLQTSYSKAINKRTHRVGHLFQGTFKDKCIGKTEYLVHLSRYIHLNPTLAGLVDLPEDWEFSSYRDYIRLRQGTLVEKETILSEFDDAESYRKFVMDYQDALNIQDLILEED